MKQEHESFSTDFSKFADRVSKAAGKILDDAHKGITNLAAELSKVDDIITPTTKITADNGDIIITGAVRTLLVNGHVIVLPDSAKAAKADAKQSTSSSKV